MLYICTLMAQTFFATERRVDEFWMASQVIPDIAGYFFGILDVGDGVLKDLVGLDGGI